MSETTTVICTEVSIPVNILPESSYVLSAMREDVLPLYDYRLFFASDRDSVMAQAERSGDVSMMESTKALFAKDDKCLDWCPPSNTPLCGKMSSIYPKKFNVRNEMLFDLDMKIKYLLHMQLYLMLHETFLRGAKMTIPEALFHPGDKRLDKTAALHFALFRCHVLPRYYDSTRQFWEEFVAVYDIIKGHGYQWDWSMPELSLKECREMMDKKGDGLGIKMAGMLVDCLDDIPKFTSVLSADHWEQ